MLNSVDRRVVIRTIIFYAAVIFLFIYGFKQFTLIPFIAHNPQIKAGIALLLVVAISAAKLKTEITFLICGIMGSFIMGIPLNQYAEYLWKNASSTSIFMIAISGAVVAVLARGDLLGDLKTTDRIKEPEKYLDLQHQVLIFCLFNKLQVFITRIKTKSVPLASLVFFFQSMLLFVSSVVTASTFSAMLKNRKLSDKENAYTNAAILCMCVSGCLLMFFFMKSPWWLFYSSIEPDVQVNLPLATLIYALFSFVHGYYLLHKAESFSTVELKVNQQTHPLAQRHFMIYIGLIIVFLLGTLQTTLVYITAANNKADMSLLSIFQKGRLTTSDSLNLGISSVLVLILAGILIATVITRQLMQKNSSFKQKNNTLTDLHQLVLGDSKSGSGIKSVIGIIVLIVTILGFKDMINYVVTPIGGGSQVYQGAGINLMNTEGILALFVCLMILVVVYMIGKILGSNFGAFSIGMIIFGIVAGKMLVLNHILLKRWIMEGIIIVSTFCNQVSPESSNAATLISDSDKDQRIIQTKAWKVSSFFGWKAYNIQIMAMAICVILSGIFTVIGLK